MVLYITFNAPAVVWFALNCGNQRGHDFNFLEDGGVCILEHLKSSAKNLDGDRDARRRSKTSLISFTLCGFWDTLPSLYKCTY